MSSVYDASDDRSKSLSPSRVESFLSCPLAYRFVNIDNLPEAPSPHATKGSLVHRALELLFGLPRPERTRTAGASALATAVDEYRIDPDFVGLRLTATEADQTEEQGEKAARKKDEWLSQFIIAFGTDEGDDATTFNGSIPQVLMMFNGDLIKKATSAEKGSFLTEIATNKALKPADKINYLFMAGLARTPNKNELDIPSVFAGLLTVILIGVSLFSVRLFEKPVGNWLKRKAISAEPR